VGGGQQSIPVPRLACTTGPRDDENLILRVGFQQLTREGRPGVFSNIESLATKHATEVGSGSCAKRQPVCEGCSVQAMGRKELRRID
jgi:hypothetical protein